MNPTIDFQQLAQSSYTVPSDVSARRTSSPNPDLASCKHPFTGIQLIVRGLRASSPMSARDHLREVLTQIESNGQPMPAIKILCPSDNVPYDYVFLALDGSLEQQSRCDILTHIMGILNQCGADIQAAWRISSGGIDKARQLSFYPKDGLSPTDTQSKLDNTFKANKYTVMHSFVGGGGKFGNRVSYIFADANVVQALINTPPVIDGAPCIPRRPRYVEPQIGLEIGILNVGELPAAWQHIDSYIEKFYGPVYSRLELDDNLYVASLKDPATTAKFLSDPFTLFEDVHLSAQPRPPSFLYKMNSEGLSTSFRTATSTSSGNPEANTYVLQQLGDLRDVINTLSQSFTCLIDEHSNLTQQLVGIQENTARMFAISAVLRSAEGRLQDARGDLKTLRMQQAQIPLLMGLATTKAAKLAIETHQAGLDTEISHAAQVVAQQETMLANIEQAVLPPAVAQEVASIVNTAHVGTVAHGHLASHTTPPTPQQPMANKRPRLEEVADSGPNPSPSQPASDALDTGMVGIQH